MVQKETKDKFKTENKPLPREPHPINSFSAGQYAPIDEDPQYKAFIEVEKSKMENKRKYAEELLQVAFGMLLPE